MMLYYDSQLQKWKHGARADLEVSFGFNAIRLAPEQGTLLPENSHNFTLLDNNGNIGPLIGIMAGMSPKQKLSGNGGLFQALQAEVTKRNGMIVIFPPETLAKDGVTGITFLPDLHKWIPVRTPLPHVVYNRVPLRRTETLPAFLDAQAYFSALGIPFFNPSFINKQKLFEMFSTHAKLSDLLPESIQVESMDQLSVFLEQHRGLYAKPASSAKGKGIFRLRLENDHLEYVSHRHKLIFPDLESFWEVGARKFLYHGYIAQKEILPKTIGGKRFDFRVLAHEGMNGYEVTGIGIRQSHKQDLTTHLHNGGKLMPYEKYQNDKHDQFFAEIVPYIGNVLTEHLGYFGEFSIDAGIGVDGRYVIYEVNSKPMSFNEPLIEKKRISALTDLFFKKAGF